MNSKTIFLCWKKYSKHLSKKKKKKTMISEAWMIAQKFYQYLYKYQKYYYAL